MIALILDQSGQALDLAHTLELGGWEVLVFIADSNQRDVGEGILTNPIVESWGRYCRSVDMIVSTGTGQGNAIESLRKKGFTVIGGTSSTDRLSNDRVFAMEVAKSLRLKVPKWKEFKLTDVEAAVKYAKKWPGLLFKSPYGFSPKWTTYKGDIVTFLKYVTDTWAADEDKSFILQEHIDGVPMRVGAWFNGYSFCKPYFNSWKFGSVVLGRYVGRSKLFNTTLKRIEPFLKANGYVGYFEIDTVIKDGTPYFIDFTMGLNSTTTHLMLELQREDLGNFLSHLSKGNVKNVKVMSRWVSGIEVNASPVSGIPIMFNDALQHTHLGGVKKVGDQFLTAGTSGFVALPVGHAIHMDMAIQRAKETRDMIYVPTAIDQVIDVDMSGMELLKEWRFL